MSRRPSSIALLLLVLAMAAAAIWAISTRSRPALAVYDSMPAAPAPADTLVSDTLVRDTSAAGTASAGKPAGHITDSAAVHPPRGAQSIRAVTPDTSDSTTHPHRSDNYGGYSGYGSKERRGVSNAR